MTNTLTRKDFLHYLAHVGNFNKVIYLNKKLPSKLAKDLKEDHKPIIIDGNEGYVGENDSWTPKLKGRK